MSEKSKYFVGLLMKEPFGSFIDAFNKGARSVLGTGNTYGTGIDQVTLTPPFELSPSEESAVLDIIQSKSLSKSAVIAPNSLNWIMGTEPDRVFYVLTYQDIGGDHVARFRKEILGLLRSWFPVPAQDDGLQVPYLLLGSFTNKEKIRMIASDFAYQTPLVAEIDRVTVFKEIGGRWVPIG